MFSNGKIISFNNFTCVILFRFFLCSKSIIVPKLQESQTCTHGKAKWLNLFNGSFFLGMDFWLGQRASYLFVSWWSKCFDFFFSFTLNSFVYLYSHWIGLSTFLRPVVLLGMVWLSSVKDKMLGHMGHNFPVR